jgi:hypothetical protein
MGVQFDRILDDFTGPFQKITAWNVKVPNKVVGSTGSMIGYTLDRHVNNSFIAVNRMLKSVADVRELPNGDFFVWVPPNRFGGSQAALDSLGLTFSLVPEAPKDARALRIPRVGLWDMYGGSIDAGWARWILEQFEFPFDRVFAPQLDAGNLNAKYDALVFVDGALPGQGGGRGAGGGGRGGQQPSAATIPAEYRSQLGRVTAETTYPKLKEFLENGGTIVAIGSSATNFADWLKVPVGNHLADASGPYPTTKFYVPGSLLTAAVDTTSPYTRGMSPRTDFFFERNPVFKLLPGADSVVTKLAWFDNPAPLHSGWALGQELLDGGVAALSVRVGKGTLLMYGPEILQRAQPHATFKLLFNAIVESAR